MTTAISTPHAPAAIGPYVQGMNTGSFIMTSGQLPIDPETGNMPEDVMLQTRQSLENVKAVVEAAGLKVANICKMTVFVKDLNDFVLVNEMYQDFFNKNEAPYPARSCVEVARLPKDALIEIEAIAIA